MRSSKMNPDELKAFLADLPDAPGVYRYYNAEGELIYVGKAKSLKKRVSSYFANKSQHDRKTLRLVLNIASIEFTLVDTEYDALLLENALIKANQPRYNINLRDDKTYPWVLITDEPFPRIFPTRKMIKGRGKYLGPFASVGTMKMVLDLVKKTYHVRTCKLAMTPETVKAGKFKVCLEYHIGNCLGPCEGHQSLQDYNEEIEEVAKVLKGNLSEAKSYLKQQMQQYAANMAFEKAQDYKDRLDRLEQFQSKSVVSNANMPDTDVITLVSADDMAYINYLQVRKGGITQTFNMNVRREVAETDAETLATVAIYFQDTFSSKAKHWLTNIPLDIEIPGIEVSTPVIGDKRRIIELSLKNVMYYRQEQMIAKGTPVKEKKTERLLMQMKEDLHLNNLPRVIECFDNSNTQGTNPVSAMVCFKDGVPSKKYYRHYNIRTVEGPDDFATMYEVVTRRYSRLLEEQAPLPDLIVIDGGKGQVSSAMNALEALGLAGKIPLIGLAKRLEEVIFPNDEVPHLIDKRSQTIRVLTHIRDEAHRFGITHHRLRRTKASTKNQLEEIPGIGPRTLETLYKEFKTLKAMRTAKLEAIAAIVGMAKAKIVKAALEKED